MVVETTSPEWKSGVLPLNYCGIFNNTGRAAHPTSQVPFRERREPFPTSVLFGSLKVYQPWYRYLDSNQDYYCLEGSCHIL